MDSQRSNILSKRGCRRLLTAYVRHFLVASVVISAFCTILLYQHLSFSKPVEPIRLKKFQMDKPRGKVLDLAKEQSNILDSPFNGYETNYEMKKTMAVLLDDIMTRMDRLESKYGHLLKFKTYDIQQNKSDHTLNFAAILSGAQELCLLSEDDKLDFPDCDSKVEWMTKHWKSDPCYAKMGVDGSGCSAIIYLSEVETFCPVLPIRHHLLAHREPQIVQNGTIFNYDLAALLKSLTPEKSEYDCFDFIRARIAFLWPEWVKAAKWLEADILARGMFNATHSTIKKQRILFHLGFLAPETGLEFAKKSHAGGPLGELVQWSDVIASHYILGHEIIVSSKTSALASYIKSIPMADSSCQLHSSSIVDIIFTDLMGLMQFRRHLATTLDKFQCLFRILDTFGTQPKFNHKTYAETNKIRSPWGMKLLQPKQFYTFFPHTPDNSFLGFVIPPVQQSAPGIFKTREHPQGKPIALVYGKEAYMWQDKRQYLDIISEFFDVHATVADATSNDPRLPPYVKNRGLLSPAQFHEFLFNVTVFVGLGFPYEGPAPLEAIAYNAIFLNPRFKPPHSRQNTAFFKDKPTDRLITSQHPYIEEFIGEPYSYLVDMDNATQVRSVLLKILSQPLSSHSDHPRIPFELTTQGMLQRVFYYLNKQNFCSFTASSTSQLVHSNLDVIAFNRLGHRIWPPLNSTEFYLGLLGETCTQTCSRRNRTCEPLHFPWINRIVDVQERGILCSRVLYRLDPIAPAITNRSPSEFTCMFQIDPLLYSCSESNPEYSRLCPCRDYLPDQRALCVSCL